MREVMVIEDPAAAAVALDPIRSRLLAELTEPASAAGLAKRLDIPRQKVNYHLRMLEEHGLVELAEVKAWGGITERVVRSTAASYVVASTALLSGADPAKISDRISADYLAALGARIVSEIGHLVPLATNTDLRLPTLGIDAEIGFASPEDRAAFAEELTAAIQRLAAKYHHDDGRPHRLVVVSHPTPPPRSNQ